MTLALILNAGLFSTPALAAGDAEPAAKSSRACAAVAIRSANPPAPITDCP